MVVGRCPVCAESGGFHDDQKHASIRANIPRHLILEKGWQREQDQTGGNSTVDAQGSETASRADTRADGDGAATGAP